MSDKELDLQGVLDNLRIAQKEISEVADNEDLTAEDYERLILPLMEKVEILLKKIESILNIL